MTIPSEPDPLPPGAGFPRPARSSEASLLLAGARLADERQVDVLVRDGRIEAVTGPGGGLAAERRVDLDGYLLLPAPAEPHAHLDRALTAARLDNPAGDLAGAMAAWDRYRRRAAHDEVVERATRAALLLLAKGATAIRSHVEVGGDVGLRLFEALVEVREGLRTTVELQLAAFAANQLTGRGGARNRAALRDAVALGADVIGGCPQLDPDPAGHQLVCLQIAEDLGRPVDLHTDETLDPAVPQLSGLAERVTDGGFPDAVTASYCVSLGVHLPETAPLLAERVAAAGISVVCCQRTNLFMQAGGRTEAPRLASSLRVLLDAGVTVAAGGDNLQDPFNTMGRGDPLEVASLLVAAANLPPWEAYRAVSAGSRAAIGLPEVGVAAGFPAELLAVRAPSLPGAVATADPQRLVVHRGRVVCSTTVTREFPDHRAARNRLRTGNG
jgi:cytosine deaminase